jgi:DNA repair photolyase
MGRHGGPLQRPHLTLNSKLIGTGAFAEPPLETTEYKRGYLCGMVRGDGHLSTRDDVHPAGRRQLMHRFRLARTDFEGIARTFSYLDELGVETQHRQFARAHGNFREIHAIGASSRASVASIREFVAWPRHASPEWYKGFLAGIYDAEGNFSGSGCVRICNTDPELIDWTTFACRRLGIPFVVEQAGEGKWNVRVRGGLEQQLRFFHLTDPAISGKRSIEGRAVTSQSRLRVVGIEPVGEMPLYDITTGTGDFIADGVVSHNCFARPTHEYLEMNAGRDFEKEIVVKVNVPEVLRKELARPSWKRQHIAMGTNTDPYQWVEGRYKLMRGIWEVLRDAANPCSILTKSPLLLRDLDLMQQVAERTEISACLSVPTLDEKAWRATEPHTPHPRARLEAVAKLNAAGIPTGILIAPLLPGINDAPEQIERIIEIATEAGAVSIGGQTLFLAGSTREVYFEWLRSYRPDLVPWYERLYARGSRVPVQERREIERAAGLPTARLRADPERATHRGSPRRAWPPPRREEVRQESLF